MSNPRRAPVHVAAGALLGAPGSVLIAQRPAGKRGAGRWEFPGGKLEPGETPRQALARELREELGITVEGIPRPLMRVLHEYPYGDVLIDMWVVEHYAGEPCGLDGQALRWCAIGALDDADLLPADRPIIAALRLPARLEALTTADYRVIEFETWVATARDDAALARHATDRASTDGARDRLTGVSCGSVADARSAAAMAGATGAKGATGADFIVLRSVVEDAALAALCGSLSQPVYARVGGARSAESLTPDVLSTEALEHAWSLGATGIHAG